MSPAVAIEKNWADVARKNGECIFSSVSVSMERDNYFVPDPDSVSPS